MAQTKPDSSRATLDAIPARSRFVAKPQPHAVAAELAQQTVQGRVGDPAVLPHFAAQAARRHRDDNPFLVNIEPNVSDPIRPDPSPMHEARHRPIRRNPRYLHTVRRLAPYSGGHVVSYLYLPWRCDHFFYTQTKSNQRSLKRRRRTIKQNRRMIKRHRRK